MTRPCRACDGTGLGTAHVVSNGLCCPSGSECIDCLACYGSGTITERIPASDAIADAETLRWETVAVVPSRDGGSARETRARAHNGRPPTGPAKAYAMAYYYVAEAGIQGTMAVGGARDFAYERGQYAARAAFRAVPGLRGE